jgi:hypothetical protein
MNDTELDELLDQWSAPAALSSLRERMRAGFTRPARFYRPRKSRLVVAVLAAAAAVTLIVTQAFPQKTALIPAPWIVDSEFVRYADDGSSSVEMYMTSYEFNSNETVLSRSMPANPFKTAVWRALDATLPAWYRLSLTFQVDRDRMEKLKQSRPPGVQLITGCGVECMVLEHFSFARSPTGCGPGPIIDHATILNYSAIAVRVRWTEHGRMTVWMAPDLGCFALQVTHEVEQPDGTFRLVAEKRARKVRLTAVN